MSVNTYQKGDDIDCFADFRSAAGTYMDPAAVYCKVQDPDGTETTYTYGESANLVRLDTGKYRCRVDANMSGTWFYKWYSTGTGKAAGESEFVVERSQF